MGKNIIIGYDLDGVIAEEPWWLKIAFALNLKLGIYLRQFVKVKYFPIKVGYIITGRPEEDRTVIERWLIKNNIRYKELIMPPKFIKNKNIALFKSTMIHDYNIRLYIESNSTIINELRQLLDNFDCSVLPFRFTEVLFLLGRK